MSDVAGRSAGPHLDASFTALPYRSLGDAALQRASELGVSHADFRFERVRYQHLGVRDGVLQGASDTEDLGFAVRVIHRGAWGLRVRHRAHHRRGGPDRRDAVSVALVAGAMTTTAVELAPEPVYDDVTWVSSYAVNPPEVSVSDKAALLIDWTERLRTGGGGRPRHGVGAAGPGEQVLRRPDRDPHDPAADSSGPGRGGHGGGRRHLRLDVQHRSPGGSRLGYLTTGAADGGWDWDAEIEEIPELLAEKLKAPSVEAGSYDLVVHPSNLWLTIHSRSATPPSSTGPWATKPTTPAPRSRRTTSSAPCSTAAA